MKVIYLDVNFYRNVASGQPKELELFDAIKTKIIEGKLIVLYSETHEIELGTLYPESNEEAEVKRVEVKNSKYKAALGKIEELGAIKIKNPPEIQKIQSLRVKEKKSGGSEPIIQLGDIIGEYQGRETQPFWFPDTDPDTEKRFRRLIKSNKDKSKKQIYDENIAQVNKELHIDFANEIPVAEIMCSIFGKIGSQERNPDQWKKYKHDFLDARHISGALPYCDIIQVDRSMKINLIESKFDQKFGCKILSLGDLEELIGIVKSI